MNNDLDFTSESLYKSLSELEIKYNMEKIGLKLSYDETREKMLAISNDENTNPTLKNIIDKILAIDIEKPLSQDDLSYLQNSRTELERIQREIEEGLKQTKAQLDSLMNI